MMMMMMITNAWVKDGEKRSKAPEDKRTDMHVCTATQ